MKDKSFVVLLLLPRCLAGELLYTPKLKKNMILEKNINFGLIFFRVGGHRPQTLPYTAFRHLKNGKRPQKQQFSRSVPI